MYLLRYFPRVLKISPEPVCNLYPPLNTELERTRLELHLETIWEGSIRALTLGREGRAMLNDRKGIYIPVTARLHTVRRLHQ